MKIKGPAPVVVTPALDEVSVSSMTFDDTHGTVVYGSGGPHGQKYARQPIPASLKKELEAFAKSSIETQEKWKPGSAAVVVPPPEPAPAPAPKPAAKS